MSIATVETLDGSVAGRLAGRLARHVQANPSPSVAQIVSWMDLVDLCRELDDCLISAEAPSEEVLSLHDAVLSLAIGCGSWLLHQIQTSQVDISASGQTRESLEASLELLRILHRSRHSAFSSSEVEAAQKRIFNAPA